MPLWFEKMQRIRAGQEIKLKELQYIMVKYVQILTAVSSKKEAQRIANLLIENNLAACVQILGPIESVYKWKGKKEKAEEFLCLIKSLNSKSKLIIKEIKSLHSYEVPEIIVTPIIGGNPDYFKWMEKEE